VTHNRPCTSFPAPSRKATRTPMAQARTSAASTHGEARIGGGTRVRGRVSGDGNLVIEGHVEGEIAVRGDLLIDQGGSVVSDIDAQAVVVAGSLEGDVSATGTVAVRAGARVRGDLRGSEVTLEEGAEFTGRLDCEFDLPAELEGAKARR
jgi:cytoskeletal protein CcmA (bactofilin family)